MLSKGIRKSYKSLFVDIKETPEPRFSYDRPWS
jgi:hypothetical protein